MELYDKELNDFASTYEDYSSMILGDCDPPDTIPSPAPIEMDLSTPHNIIVRFMDYNQIISNEEFDKLIKIAQHFNRDQIMETYSECNMFAERRIKIILSDPSYKSYEEDDHPECKTIKEQLRIFNVAMHGFFLAAYYGYILEDWEPKYPERNIPNFATMTLNVIV